MEKYISNLYQTDQQSGKPEKAGKMASLTMHYNNGIPTHIFLDNYINQNRGSVQSMCAYSVVGKVNASAS